MREFQILDCGHIYREEEIGGECAECGRICCRECIEICDSCGKAICPRHQKIVGEELCCPSCGRKESIKRWIKGLFLYLWEASDYFYGREDNERW